MKNTTTAARPKSFDNIIRGKEVRKAGLWKVLTAAQRKDLKEFHRYAKLYFLTLKSGDKLVFERIDKGDTTNFVKYTGNIPDKQAKNAKAEGKKPVKKVTKKTAKKTVKVVKKGKKATAKKVVKPAHKVVEKIAA